MNRRDFLGGSVAIAAGITGRAYPQIPATHDRVRLGVIGCGRRGTIVSAAFLEDPRVNIVAVCDVYDQQIAQYTTQLKLANSSPRSFVAYEDLLSLKEVDAVLITTPDHLHLTVAKAALAAGKNVYLEKPTLHRWSERIELTQAADTAKRTLQCGTQQRSGAHYIRAKQELFDSGKLGKVLFARAVWHNFPWQQRHITNEAKPAALDWDRFLGPAKHVPYETVRYTSWRYFPDYGAGLLADILTHWVDVAQWMLNDADPQMAAAAGGIYGQHDGRENPDTVSALLRYRDWNLNFESSVLSIRNQRPTVFFEGTEGTLDLAREGYIYTPNNGQPVTVNASESLEVAHTRNFLDAIVKGLPLNAPLSAGIDASRPVQMSLQSYWTGKEITSRDLT
jgi:predicted dehydrogenase